MRSTSMFSCIMTITTNFTIIFILKNNAKNDYFQSFPYKYNRFVHFYMIPAVLLLIISFLSFLKLLIFIACSLKYSQKFFIQSLSLHTSCLFSMLLNEDIVVIGKPDSICSLTFVLNYFSGLFFTSINLFYYTFKIFKNNKWWFIRFLILIKF